MGKNNKDIKFEKESEEPRLGKIVNLGLNFAKDTKSNSGEVVENNKGTDLLQKRSQNSQRLWKTSS